MNINKSIATSAFASVATTAALMILSKRRTGSSWAALNSIAHMVVPGEAPQTFSPVHSSLGVVLNAAAISGWAVLHDVMLASNQKPRSLITGSGMSAAAYFFDYHLAPPRLVPGFEKILKPSDILICYVALAAALALPSGSE